MLVRAVAEADTSAQAKTILFDSWYAAADNLKLIHRLNLNTVQISTEAHFVAYL